MSKSVFNNSITSPDRIIVLNQFMYITASGPLLRRLDITNGTLVNNYATISSIANNSFGQMSTDGTYIYIPTESPPYKIIRVDTRNATVLDWKTIPAGVSGSTIIGGFLYISISSYQELYKINLSTLELTLVLGIEEIGGLTTDGTYIYVDFHNYTKYGNSNRRSIARVNITNNTALLTWAEPNFNNSAYACEILSFGGFIYQLVNGSDRIIQINRTTAAITNSAYSTTFGGIGPVSISTDGTFGYVTNNTVIYKVTLESALPTALSYNSTTKVLTWTGTAPFDSFIIQDLTKGLDVTSTVQSFNLTSFLSLNPSVIILNVTIKQVTSGITGPASSSLTINLTPPAPTGLSYNPSTKVLTWIGTAPFDSFIIQDLTKGLDVTSTDQSYNLTSFISMNPSVLSLNITVKQVSSGITGPASSSLFSEICFPKDTPITTDQGIIPIQEIRNQTINGLKVEHITQIVGTFKHLVCFEKDALYLGCPSEKTIMTRNHKVSYNGEMVEAGTLLNEHIYLIPYNGETLYNVLLEENGTMNVNNLLCETLDTNNIIAHFYRSTYNPEEKRKITDILNDFHGTPYYDKVAGLFFDDNRLN
jgi:hypothetical protein